MLAEELRSVEAVSDPGGGGRCDSAVSAAPNGAAAGGEAVDDEEATDATDTAAAAAAAVEEAVAVAEAAAAAEAAEAAEAAAAAAAAAEAAEAAEAPNMKRRHAIYEIIDSEESYVNKLRFIAEKYIPLKDDPDVPLPPDLEEKWSIIWGNWWRLLEGHEEILAKLKQAFETDLDTVANVFIAKERHMSSWYSKYCENHRKAQHIACDQYRDFFEQLRQNLRDKEDMNSHLMNPVQRCMRYSLLVGTVIDKARKDGLQGPGMAGWERMLEIMRELPLKTESIMEASRIDNLEPGIRVTSLGQVRIKGVLRLGVINGPYDPNSNPPPSQLKFEQRKIFLFDQMMLVTEVKRTGKAKAGDPFSGLQTIYIYRSKVKMNNMRYFASYKYSATSNPVDENDELLFCVVDTTPSANVVYVFDPVDTTTRTQWVVELRQMEKQQMDFLKILQNPVAGASDHLAAPAETSKKSAKDKEKGRSDSRKKGKLSFGSSKSRKSRAETETLPRPQSSRERKNSCPDAEAAAAAAAAAAGDTADGLSADRANKELKKVHSEVGSSSSYDQDGGAASGSSHGIAKKKSGLNFSLQSIFSTKKSKSRSDSKLNPT